jgi:hypothetical protein
VLIEVDLDDTHVDYVTNDPEFNGPILRARFIRGKTDLAQVFESFPDRSIYLCQPNRKVIQRLKDTHGSTNEDGT